VKLSPSYGGVVEAGIFIVWMFLQQYEGSEETANI